MSSYTAAGAILAISAAAPVTRDKAGYSALAFTTIGEITNIGEFGREYAKIEHKPIATRGTVKIKGGFDDGQLSLQMACDEKDAGQTLLEAASNSDNDYSFSLTRLDGTVHYFPAKTMSFKRNVGERDSIITVQASLEITQVNGVGVVTSKPA